LNYMRDTWDM